MSYHPVDKTKLIDTNYDAFSRLRISEPVTEFESKFFNGIDNGTFTSQTIGAGSVSYLANESSVQLQVGTASGDRALRESTRYVQYQPGKSLLIFASGLLGPAKANVESRIGYYDDNDGYYFANTATGPIVVERASVSGSIVTTTVTQDNWNVDKMDGTGPSGIIFDAEKVQVFFFDMQWLGVGRVRVGLDIAGEFYTVHEFNHANLLTTTFIKSGSQPVRYEIVNTGTAASSSTMKQICSTGISEGGYDPYGPLHTADTGSTAVSIGTGTLIPIMSFRVGSTFGGNPYRGFAEFVNIDILNTSTNDLTFRFVRNASLTGDTFAPHSAGSVMQVDSSATALTGGEVSTCNYVPAGAVGGGTASAALRINEFRTYTNPNTAAQETWTLAAEAYGGTADCHFSVTWRENQ